MEEKLTRAFQLAYFILREEPAALRATGEAVAALDVTLTRQDKRLHYQSGHRTKVSLGELQMLQRLVYFVSETEERRQEEQGASEPMLVLHFIKHLIYITICRNSFFVSLGLSRLLHNYSTSESAQIHGIVAQNPDRERDDSYYRRRKAQLMRELQSRFGSLLTVQRGTRNEERFKTLPEAGDYPAWIKECLERFTPWETNCVLPASFDPFTDELMSLRFRGDDPDGEHPVEIRRFHTLLHPNCFDRILEALSLDASSKRLEVPQFELRDHHPPASPRGRPPADASLSEEVMNHLKESILQERERRRRFIPSWLHLVVDGAERARWPLAHTAGGRIELSSTDTLIEIFGANENEKFRLAAYFLEFGEDDRLQPVDATITLECGQQVNFEVACLDTEDEADPIGTAAVSSPEPTPARVGLWRRLFATEGGWNLKPALVTILAMLLSAAIMTILRKPRISHRDDAAISTPSPLGVEPTVSQSVSGSPNFSPTPRPASPPIAADDVIAMDFRQGGGSLRTRRERADAIGLLQAQKVYLSISGPQSNEARRLLMKHLPVESSINLIEVVDEADLAIKASVKTLAKGQIEMIIHLADANGEAVWPLTPGKDRRKYTGSLEKVIVAFSRDLARDLKQLGR
jgi:hypothetical protein